MSSDTRGRMTPRENCNLGFMLLGDSLSTLGTQATAVALPLLLLNDFAASAATLSVFAAARYVPFTLLGRPVGAYVDGRDPQRVMLAADAFRFFLLASVPVLYILGALSIPVLLVAVLLVGTGRVAFDVSAGVLLLRLFRKEQWLAANSRQDALFAVSETSGPAIAGAIAGAFGAIWAVVLDAVTFVVSFVCVRSLRVLPRPDGSERLSDAEGSKPVAYAAPEAGTLSGKAANPLRILWTEKTLRLFIGAACLQNAGLMTLQGVAIYIMVVERDLSQFSAGLILGCLGLGGVAGALVAPRLVRAIGWTRTARLSGIVAASAPLLLLTDDMPGLVGIYCAAYVLLGVGVTLTSTTTRRYRQEVIPEEVFARVGGVVGSLLMGSLPVGALLGGLLASSFNGDVSLLVSSAIFAAGAWLLILGVRRAPTTIEVT